MAIREDEALLEQLAPFEQRLIWPSPGTTREQIESLLGAEFHEIGASGRRLDRAYGIGVLLERAQQAAPEELLLTDRKADRVAPDLLLHTYRLSFSGRASRRATLWRRVGEGWVALFHQGTVVAQD